MPTNPLNRILLRMFIYGFFIGVLMVCLVIVGLIATPSPYTPMTPSSESGDLSGLFIIALIIGAWVGIAGLCSGIGMVGRIETAFPDDLIIHHIRDYRTQVAKRTLIIASIVLAPFIFPVWMLVTINSAIFLIIPPLMLAMLIGAGQLTISQYLRDIDLRKKKRG